MPGGLPQPGDVLAGKYDIIRVLGLGGMGIVLEAMHTRLSQRVAIKCLLPAMLEDPRSVKRFEREARAVARLRSRYVVRVLDVESTPEGLPYMVMEMLHGHDLSRELEARGTLPLVELVDYCVQICSALAEACGAGITHRDLKPSNIYLAQEPEGRIAKVLDFGIAKTSATAISAASGSVAGTPHYMSPEQLRDTENVGPQSDLWALGVIMYEALAGKCPFDGRTVPALAVAITTATPVPLFQLRPDLPAAFCDVVMSTLEKEQSKRCPDARTLAEGIFPYGSRREALPSGHISLPSLRDVVSVTGETDASGLGATIAMPQSVRTAPETRSTEPLSLPRPDRMTRAPAVQSRRIALVAVILLSAVSAAVFAMYGRQRPPDGAPISGVEARPSASPLPAAATASGVASVAPVALAPAPTVSAPPESSVRAPKIPPTPPVPKPPIIAVTATAPVVKPPVVAPAPAPGPAPSIPGHL